METGRTSDSDDTGCIRDFSCLIRNLNRESRLDVFRSILENQFYSILAICRVDFDLTNRADRSRLPDTGGVPNGYSGLKEILSGSKVEFLEH